MELQSLLDAFVAQSRAILGDCLTGVYLHGSAAMGCFQPQKSDVDLLIVVENALPDELKLQYMAMVTAMNDYAPQKGIEMSVLRRDVCKPFVYPTPYELHFSVMHLERYQENPAEYVRAMHGEDKDLAAHCMMLRHRGVRLYGPEIEQVFGPVSDEVFENSIYQDIRTAQEDILKAPVYVILNLCRAVAYIEEGLLLSKREGVEWALNDWQLAPYQGMIRAALKAYQEGESMPLDHEAAQNFARIMLSRFTTRPFSPFEKQWMALFAADIPREVVQRYVHDTGNYIWHVFSFELKPRDSFAEKEEAKRLFDAQDKRGASYYEPWPKNGEHEPQYDSPSADDLEELTECYVIAVDKSWTYILTHEDGILGPYLRGGQRIVAHQRACIRIGGQHFGNAAVGAKERGQLWSGKKGDHHRDQAGGQAQKRRYRAPVKAEGDADKQHGQNGKIHDIHSVLRHGHGPYAGAAYQQRHAV